MEFDKGVLGVADVVITASMYDNLFNKDSVLQSAVL